MRTLKSDLKSLLLSHMPKKNSVFPAQNKKYQFEILHQEEKAY